MIVRLTGTVLEKNKNSLVIETASGIGYEVMVIAAEISKYEPGEEITLFTYLKVTENAQELYGFASGAERCFFVLLLSVSGVGPKTAMNILALGSIQEIEAAIARADVQYLIAVQGMGKKMAERLVVELKGKVKEIIKIGTVQTFNTSLPEDITQDIFDSLESLGYSQAFVRKILQAVVYRGESTEVFLKRVLQQASRF